jgi:carbonic anhydrase
MDKMREGVRRYRAKVFPYVKPRLEQLMREGQKPEVLVIACSDSRIKINEFTQSEAGDLFVVRNAGNIVPPWTNVPSGVAASIEYAVRVLPIRDVIIAGHTGCGAMGALLHPHQIEHLPSVRQWLSYAPMVAPCEDDHMLAEVTRQNVVLQLEHLREYPCIQEGVQAGKLALHGWVYHIETGEVWEYAPDGWTVI